MKKRPKKYSLTGAADFLYEVGIMRKIMRAHCHTLMTHDMSDNIASHSYRVAIIGWLLAKMEGVDVYKVVMTCLFHDIVESRSGDRNWINRRYVTVDAKQITDDQMSNVQFPEFRELVLELMERTSREAIVAKDADTLDQLLLQKEYAMQGNLEAVLWLNGKRDPKKYRKVSELRTKSAKALGRAIYDRNPSEWWKNVFVKSEKIK